MIQIDPHLLIEDIVLDLANWLEVGVDLRTSSSIKILRPICIISNLIDYIQNKENL